MRHVVGALLVLALLLAAPVAQAGGLQTVTPANSRTVTIADDDYEAFKVDVPSTWNLVMSVRVTSGGNIDVYVTTQSGYSDYINPLSMSFQYYATWTRENINSYNQTISQTGAIYVVLDNAAVTASGANPNGPVTVELYFGKSEAAFQLGMIVIILVVVILVIILAVVVLRKRRKAAAPPPPQAPPMTPPAAPPPPN